MFNIGFSLVTIRSPKRRNGPYILADGMYRVHRDRERTQTENVQVTALHPDVKISHSIQAPGPNFVGVLWLRLIGSGGEITDWAEWMLLLQELCVEPVSCLP